MKDEFLNQFYEVPRDEFASALYKRLSQDPPTRVDRPLWRYLTFRNSIVAFVLLFFIAACVYAFVDRGWRQVGGIWMYVQNTYTLDLTLPADFTPPAETSEELEIQPPECWSVEEAKEILRFDFRVPTWAPEGFSFDDRVCGIDKVSGYASLYWMGPDKDSGINVELSNLRWYDVGAQQYRMGQPSVWEPVAPGSYEEVQIHGQPAVLVRGNWEEPFMAGFMTHEMVAKKYEFKWDNNRGIQLHWLEGEVMYSLFTLADVSDKDAIRMAESTR
jgi:hypothetical protein